MFISSVNINYYCMTRQDFYYIYNKNIIDYSFAFQFDA